MYSDVSLSTSEYLNLKAAQRKLLNQEVNESTSLIQRREKSVGQYYGAVTVAPVVIMYSLGYGIYIPSFIEILKYKVCEQSLNISAVICADIGNHSHKVEGDQVRTMTANYQMYSTLFECVPGIILSLFLGSWSDRFGRKLPMLLPFLGMLSASLWAALCVHLVSLPYLLMISSVFSALLGGRFVVMMAIFSYVGDHTNHKNRTFNNVLVEGLFVIGLHGGQFIGGYSFQNFGMIVPFCITSGLYASCIIYVVSFIRDKRNTFERSDGETSTLKSLFSLKNISQSVAVLRKKRTGDTRQHIILVICALFISSAAFNGKNSVTQLFLEFEPFSWSLQKFTFFTSVLGLAGSFSVVFFTAALRNCCGLPNTAIAMVAYVFAIFGYVGYSMARTNWMIYASATVGQFRLLCTVCVRTALSELVGQDEIGKVMAFVSVVQATAPLLGALIFVNIFAYTAAWWSGLCFAIGSFMLVLVLSVFAFVDIARREPRYSTKS